MNELDPLLEELTYVVYREAGKHSTYSRKVLLKNKWWEFWKADHMHQKYIPSDAEKVIRGMKFVESHNTINPYTKLIERIDKARIKGDLDVLDEEKLLELVTDVIYHCGKCTESELDDYREELLK